MGCLIDYAKLFSGHPLNLLPEFTKKCKKGEVWHVISNYIRDNIHQDMIKISYLLIYNSYNEFLQLTDKDESTRQTYLLHIDIFWQALSDENCAKIELHLNK